MYLREVGVISELQAEETLKAGATRVARGGMRDRALVRQSALVFSVMSMALLATGGAIQASAGRWKRGGEFGENGDTAMLPRSAGHVEFVVEPWADVYVDGELVATTPTAQRVALTPGRHYVKYKNPFFVEETQEVVVRPGQTLQLRAVLAPRHGKTGSKR
jgi:serine/threonine-protein kinase